MAEVSDFERNGIGVSMGGAYGLSKALLNSYTLCLAREQPGLRVNSCSPGMIATDFFGSAMPWWLPLPNALLRFLATRMMNAKTPDEGAASTVHLLFTHEQYVPGGYFGSVILSGAPTRGTTSLLAPALYLSDGHRSWVEPRDVGRTRSARLSMSTDPQARHRTIRAKAKSEMGRRAVRPAGGGGGSACRFATGCHSHRPFAHLSLIVPLVPFVHSKGLNLPFVYILRGLDVLPTLASAICV